MTTRNGWPHIEVCAKGNRIMIKQAKSQVNDNRLSEDKLLERLDSHTAHADELFLNVDDELAEALIDQLNELELPFIVRSHKISQEANGKWNQQFQAKADPDFITDRKDIIEDTRRFDPD